MSKKLNIAAEAVITYGSKSVADWQLLQAIGVPETSARELLANSDHLLSNIARMALNDIAAITGIGMNKAAAIVAAIELGRRRQVENKPTKMQVKSSLDTHDILHPHMRDATQEEFWIILLDRRNCILRTERIHIGGMACMVVDPRIIFQKALQYRACSVILSHNHPSGASSPSIDDIRLTEKIKSAGQFLDIKVLDHVIIGDGNYYSFADEGKI